MKEMLKKQNNQSYIINIIYHVKHHIYQYIKNLKQRENDIYFHNIWYTM